jgi:hypothetical protein
MLRAPALAARGFPGNALRPGWLAVKQGTYAQSLSSSTRSQERLHQAHDTACESAQPQSKIRTSHKLLG